MAAEGARIPIILDTGLGSDPGDLLALATLLRTPAVDLRAVTTVSANASRRARIALAVLAIAGRRDVPVGCGADWPLVVRGSAPWEGWEGEGILAGAEEPQEPLPYAVDLLIDQVLAEPGAVTIVAIGPLTNLALAIAREPRMAAAVRQIVVGGGMVQRRLDQLAEPYAERNIRRDPEAARLVLASGAPITLVPLDVGSAVHVRRGDLSGNAADDLRALLADQIDRHLERTGRDRACLHGALAAALPAHPEFVRTSRMHVAVETQGDLTRGQTVATMASTAGEARQAIDVALVVDAAAVESWLISCLAGPVASQG